jgi:hypothetical protein
MTIAYRTSLAVGFGNIICGGCDMKLDRLHIALVGIIVLLLSWIALTPWEYHRISGNMLIRIHRITGTTERFNISGWKEVGPAAIGTPRGFRELSSDEKILPLEPPKSPGD